MCVGGRCRPSDGYPREGRRGGKEVYQPRTFPGSEPDRPNGESVYMLHDCDNICRDNIWSINSISVLDMISIDSSAGHQWPPLLPLGSSAPGKQPIEFCV